MGPELVEVRLIRLPLAVHQRADLHMRGLQRELDLIRLRDPDATTIPHRLRALIDELDAEFGGVGVQPVDELESAVGRGDLSVDLTYQIPASAGPAAARLGDLLDEVDDYCRAQGHLLTLVTPPEALEYRRWFLGEFVRQTAGRPPTPWPDRHRRADRWNRSHSSPPAPGHAAMPLEWSVHTDGELWHLSLQGPLDLVSAPALRDALVDLTSREPGGVVDLSGCGFVDSVGISMLLAAVKRAAEHDVALRFRLSPAVERVLVVSGVLNRIDRLTASP